MTIQEEQLKWGLTPPSPGLIMVAPGLYVSKRSAREILADLERSGKLEPASPRSAPEPPGNS
jgi:hypothetical protein